MSTILTVLLSVGPRENVLLIDGRVMLDEKNVDVIGSCAKCLCVLGIQWKVYQLGLCQ